MMMQDVKLVSKGMFSQTRNEVSSLIEKNKGVNSSLKLGPWLLNTDAK